MGSTNYPSAVKNDFTGLGSFEGFIKYCYTISGITMLSDEVDVSSTVYSTVSTVDSTVTSETTGSDWVTCVVVSITTGASGSGSATTGAYCSSTTSSISAVDSTSSSVTPEKS
jgi:hypothetical protein